MRPLAEHQDLPRGLDECRQWIQKQDRPEGLRYHLHAVKDRRHKIQHLQKNPDHMPQVAQKDSERRDKPRKPTREKNQGDKEQWKTNSREAEFMEKENDP